MKCQTLLLECLDEIPLYQRKENNFFRKILSPKYDGEILSHFEKTTNRINKEYILINIRILLFINILNKYIY